ncbi:MAG TPA: acetamidase/formamidase family protein [Candidatus Angelobacter sp.]|nr:acetamidase/formamidase family protein [Candidatus Angelobacter sp.]
MTRALLLLLISAFFSLPATSTAMSPEEPASLSGRWIVTADFYGSIRYFRLHLNQKGSKLTGSWNGIPLEGTVEGKRAHLLATDKEGGTTDVNGDIENGALAGTVALKDPQDQPQEATSFHFTAAFLPPLQRGPAKRHEFIPTVFYRQFSPWNKPVLKVSPGDTIHTTTVDAGGRDEKGVRRVAGGNPETGLFYIEGAMPGDTLVVHLTRLRLNRDFAGSDDGIVESGLNSNLAVMMKDNGKSIRWKLDRTHGVASPANPGKHLANFTVPLRPMLGCVAVAPGPAGAPPPTGDSGFWGGNMDFNEITEGATLYLPVLNPGALLYLGDGHALQGDGEINGNALETSMDVEFTVDLIQEKRTPSVRVETANAIIAMGLQGSLDDAFREATSNMSQWLAEDYKLTPSEIAQVIGTTAEYKISEVADRNSGIVLKISKERLKTLVAE